MRDYEEKSYYEIQLDNKQLILVFMAAVTVCVLIFVLGVMIGKGQKEAEFAAAARNQKNSAPSEADGNEPSQALSDIAADTREEIKPEPVESKPTRASEPKKEEPKKAEPKKEEPKKEIAKSAVTPDKAKEKYAYEDLDKNEEAPPAVKEKPAPEPVKTVSNPPAEEEEPKANARSRYTVQVMATSSKPKADEQISRLKSRGYNPFMDESMSGEAMVFKVRVGRFADTREAKEMASKIKSDLKLETWVAELE